MGQQEAHVQHTFCGLGGWGGWGWLWPKRTRLAMHSFLPEVEKTRKAHGVFLIVAEKKMWVKRQGSQARRQL